MKIKENTILQLLKEYGVKKFVIDINPDEDFPYFVSDCVAVNGAGEDEPITFFQRYKTLDDLWNELLDPIMYPLHFEDAANWGPWFRAEFPNLKLTSELKDDHS